MNRRELVRAVAAQTSYDVKQVDEIVAGLTDVVTAVVAKGEPVVLPGFVKFTKVNRAARIGRNPQTGEPVKIKAKTVAKATAMKAFRDTVMAPASAPRLARGVWPTSAELLAKQADTRKNAAKSVGAKAPSKKVAPRKPVKKAPVRKAAAKKAPVRKAPAKKAPVRRATAGR
jgi:DNA-binding protein HU-beta